MKVSIITLGCKVNMYESNVMANLLEKAGYELVKNGKADIYIINTCTVTNAADKKSKYMIRKSKRENKNAIIVVTGCLSQINKSLQNQMEEIDILIGNKGKTKIVEHINKYLKDKEKQNNVKSISNSSFENMGVTSFKNKTRAFVKIQEGCENYCSYCIIPFARGKVVSKEPKKVIEEIKNLVKNGYIEIVLTGIHTGHYGSDLENYKFSDLLKEIAKIKEIKRIRISSIEINEVTDEVIKIIKENEVFARHLHLPLQSGSDKILKDMNRKYNKNFYIERTNKIKKEIRGISITTDIIVGFPTETDKDFTETYKLAKKIKFSKIHVFPFSKREGTKAANMENTVTDITKTKRVQKLLELSEKLESKALKKRLHKKASIITEKYRDGYLEGFTSEYFLAKVDGEKNEKNKELKIKIKNKNLKTLLGKRM